MSDIFVGVLCLANLFLLGVGIFAAGVCVGVALRPPRAAQRRPAAPESATKSYHKALKDLEEDQGEWFVQSVLEKQLSKLYDFYAQFREKADKTKEPLPEADPPAPMDGDTSSDDEAEDTEPEKEVDEDTAPVQVAPPQPSGAAPVHRQETTTIVNGAAPVHRQETTTIANDASAAPSAEPKVSVDARRALGATGGTTSARPAQQPTPAQQPPVPQQPTPAQQPPVPQQPTPAQVPPMPQLRPDNLDPTPAPVPQPEEQKQRPPSPTHRPSTGGLASAAVPVPTINWKNAMLSTMIDNVWIANARDRQLAGQAQLEFVAGPPRTVPPPE